MKTKQLVAIGALTGLTAIAIGAQVRTSDTTLLAQNEQTAVINVVPDTTATQDTPTIGAPITISVPVGARQTFAGLGASTGNWGGEYQSLTPAQRTQLSRMFWHDLNFKIFRLWLNVDEYSPTRGAHDLTRFREQYIKSGEIADAKANGVTTLVLAPDHIPAYMRSVDKADGPINDAEMENFVTLVAEAIKQLRDEDGITIQATGIENEPDMTPAEIARGVKRLRTELDARGLQRVKIIASEASSADDRFYSQMDAVKSDPAAWKALDGIASHSYNMAATDKAASYAAGPDGRNAKEYWMTEASDNGSEDEGMTGIPALRAASLSARFLNDMNHRVTHWVHFLGLESTRAPYTDDATRIIAFEATPFRYKVMKKYYTYQQLAQAFDVGAVFRDTQSSLDGDMTWTYGRKPHLFAATAQNPDGSWSSGICNFTSDSFLGVQGWGDDKWNIEQGGQTPAQSFPVTLQVDELKNRAAVPFVVHRTNAISKNDKAETVIMKNGVVTLNVVPLELVTLRSAAVKTR
jgi:O-glycosyl hydrolase